ncbi:hypothetical protein GCM10025863_07830 [Microbacterium suwonense]|uniref:Solute-binding protein family 3/N-terminal domain-containing protein n=1 Tax=Microbacterium suwonense TaxID=683047 RepID=A0ABN6X143_9MICO|nr:hypothetical protein GCM10025863_07830 [Microbacterium suwonense]
MKAGRLDAAAVSSQAGLTLLHGLEMVLVEDDDDYPGLTATYDFVWPSTKGNDDLTAALNEYIAHVQEGGTLKTILFESGVPDEFIDFYLNGRP